MSEIGLRLKVKDGEHSGKIGTVIKVCTESYDERGNFQQHYQILKFDDGTTAKFPLYQAYILEVFSGNAAIESTESPSRRRQPIKGV